jgi:asparagine synthase (glutamine-hydrolysing)
VNYYLSLPFTLRYSKDDQEKYLIRKAFDQEHFSNREGISLLPPNILWRRKEAFSDGVASEKTTTREIIYKHIHSLDSHAQFVSLFNYSNIDNKENILKLVKAVHETKHITHLLPETLEQFYYRYIFEIHYKGCGKVIPYFWMPNYVKAQDSSARSLDIYKDTIETDYALLPNAPDDSV